MKQDEAKIKVYKNISLDFVNVRKYLIHNTNVILVLLWLSVHQTTEHSLDG